MRYETKSDLPATMRDIMPEEAQEIYLEAFQKAWDTYEEWEGGEMSRHSVAHQKAMAIVKDDFVKLKDTGKWYHKGNVPEEEEEEGLMDAVKEKLDVENPLSS